MSTWVLIGTIPGTGGGGDGGFTDTFSLGIRLDETANEAPTDAVSVAFQFDEAANEVPTDAASLAFTLDEAANVVPTDDSSFVLNLLQGDTTTAPTDDATFAAALLLADSNADLVEAVSLGISGTDFADSTVAPTDGQVFTLRIWLSASGGTASGMGNANGQNDGTIATLQTAIAGAATIVMTSTLGPNVPTAIITGAIYRGWFKSVNTLVTSSGILEMQSTTAAFTNINMFTNAALNTTVDRLDGSFTFDLIAAGVNTLAKIQTCRMRHATVDAVAGVSPHVLTVDAGCIELVGAF